VRAHPEGTYNPGAQLLLRLKGHGGLRPGSAEIFKVFVNYFQPAVRVVITVKINPGVGRVVEFFMEGLKLFKG
jgi:hypothetical protein